MTLQQVKDRETQTYLQDGAFLEAEAVFEQTDDVCEIHAEERIELSAFRRTVTHYNTHTHTRELMLGLCDQVYEMR